MAIVINGSGTVTGISVGGLPDGIVDAGTLATNSVDSAELIDGSIDTAHIATDQITAAILPAGSVIQVVNVNRKANFTTTSASYVAQGLEATITPTATSSRIFIVLTVGTSSPSNDSAYLTIYKGGSNITGHTEGFGAVQAATVRTFATLTYTDSPSTTSATTYSLYVRTDSGNTIEIPAHSNGQQSITLMEIAG